MQNLFNDLAKILKKDERLFAEGKILKNKITELAIKQDKELLELLLNNGLTKEHFFTESKINTKAVFVFNQDKFVRFINNKEFLPNSFTAFKNHIGLVENDDYLKDSGKVVLAWPYKDCVLEGGQDKEDSKRNEIFYNEILAPDEIDRLFEPKVLTNIKKIDKTGEHEIERITEQDNLIIKGNNLLALHSLKKKYRGEVKLIYIDPPYNTGNGDGFNYNDSFNHSTWLTFMKNRLEVARQLLRDDGSIYIQLDYNEVHYCKVLMDDIFGKENFQREIIWDISVLSGYKTIANNWIRGHDSILFYSKNNKSLKFNKVKTEHSEKYLARFNKKDEKTGRMYFDGRGEKIYLDEVIERGKAIGDVWGDIISFQQAATAKERIKDFSGQKPENLLERIIKSATDEGDIVLDYHLGSGTTAAVAHKMGRQYIGIEQLDYGDNGSVARLKEVVKGDQAGISKAVHWKGGGSFVYMELKKWNEEYEQAIRGGKTSKELLNIYKKMQMEAFFRYEIDLNKFDEKKFGELELKDQKQILIESLDKNHLYVNYSEMEDATYKVPAEKKKINKAFYGN
ncbi:MAG: site-specific DNA-methyltransferase [Patescibacteria group bacterium]